MTKHVLIDTDPGIDDALALLLAFTSPELKVEGVTTVVGNVSLELANINSLKLLEFMGEKDVPVASGAAKPLSRESRNGTALHGDTGLGEAKLPFPNLRLDERTAVHLIQDKVNEYGQKLTVITLGPLTNIANAILDDNTLYKKVGKIVLMGGAFNTTPYGHGNITPVAEYNIWHDPEAAKIVFRSGIPLTAVGLDVTTSPESRLTMDMYRSINELDTRRAMLITDLCRGLMDRLKWFSLHDPLAIAVATFPNIVEKEKVMVDIEEKGELTRGMTVVEKRNHHKDQGFGYEVDACVKVDGECFIQLFWNRVVLGRAT
jgi:inosine-uridine nucleoside N-ribohydrolase